jgi:hypothetical protein
MKKILTVLTLLGGVVSGFSQTEVSFYDEGEPTHLSQQIFNQQSPAASTYAVTYGGYTTYEEMGSTASSVEYPQGNTVYATGAPLTGTGFDAQLLGAPGTGDPVSQLSPLVGVDSESGILNFFSVPAAAGLVQGSVNDIIPGSLPQGSPLTVAIAVWNNGGGQYSTLAAAQAAGEP